ncbi:unnamed protein product [Urochloa humidicola]
MAAILRSSLRRAVRSAAPSGPLAQLPPRRHLCAGRPNLAPQPQQPAERVDQLVNKAEGVAKKEVLFEYAKRLVQEQKGEYGSPIHEGSAFPWFLGVAFVAVFMAGYQVGLDQAAKKQDAENLEKATSLV